jgi:hypothetical protein
MSPIDLEQAEAFNCVAWIINKGIVNENGSPIEFRDHAFMVDPYMDDSPKLVVKKCAQIGFSTLAILRSFHLARYAGANIIHTFPSRNMSKDFVIPKVNPLIARNPALKDLVGVDRIEIKQVGDRYIYYRGSYEQTEAISISAHILMNDEYDRSNQLVLKTYRSRLDDAKRENPELGWEWQFSNPSIPGYGVDVMWGISDQKHWFVKCPHCGYDFYLKFPENIDFVRKIRICAKCQKPLSDDALRAGRWVKKYLNREISGYWIGQMFVPWISASKIIDDSLGDQDVFHNFTLGLEYISKDQSMSRQSILQDISPGFNPRNNVAIGVDNGVEKHYVIGNRLGIFKIGVTEDWEEIEKMRNQYNASMVIDALPYPMHPQKLAEKYSGKVYVHYYQEDKKNTGVIRWDQGLVKSDRTKIIDYVVAELNSHDIVFNLTEKDLEDYIKHWENMFRVVVDTPQGIRKPQWKTKEGFPDHFAHATILWRVALEQTLSVGKIISVKEPGEGKDSHPEIGPDETVPALDLEEVARKSGEPTGRGWGSI